jgi:hypothetical protein
VKNETYHETQQEGAASIYDLGDKDDGRRGIMLRTYVTGQTGLTMPRSGYDLPPTNQRWSTTELEEELKYYEGHGKRGLGSYRKAGNKEKQTQTDGAQGSAERPPSLPQQGTHGSAGRASAT